MTRSMVARSGNGRGGPKVKTGCGTCRIRKVKCDEGKPSCQKCITTGRACDGYTSPFRPSTNPATQQAHRSDVDTGVGANSTPPASTEIDPREIDILARYFSTKTIFNVKVGCDEEARQVLEASRTDAPVRHAISSLRALRDDYEITRDQPLSEAQQTPDYGYGIQEYSKALGGLASSLSSPNSHSLRSTLLCCQIFISIEQVQENHDTLAQHMIRGLKIMREARARPQLTVANTLLPAHHERLPFLDVFVVKMFAAPCKFCLTMPISSVNDTSSLSSSRSPEPSTSSGSLSSLESSTSPESLTSPESTTSVGQQPVESPDLRTIAPNMRTELTKIAASTLQFLDMVSRIDSVDAALHLLSEKSTLLGALDNWLVHFERVQQESDSPGTESIPVTFMRLFYRVLRVVLLGAVNTSAGLEAELQTEYERLQSTANNVGEKLRARRTGRVTEGS